MFSQIHAVGGRASYRCTWIVFFFGNDLFNVYLFIFYVYTQEEFWKRYYKHLSVYRRRNTVKITKTIFSWLFVICNNYDL